MGCVRFLQVKLIRKQYKRTFRETREAWIEVVPDRKGPTLMNLIRRRIAPGTRIFTDMWRGYNAIPRITRGCKPIYKHATVNHSKNFLNPADPDIHTQNMERIWRSAKRKNKIQSGTHRQHLHGYIDEFLMRRQANINNICFFDTILEGIITYMPPF